MANYKVIPAKSVEHDLESIYRYIAREAQMPITAFRTVENIKKEISDNLSYMPFYPVVDDERLAAKGYRRMVVKKYLVFFVIDEEKNIVKVRRVIHGARDWKRILIK